MKNLRYVLQLLLLVVVVVVVVVAAVIVVVLAVVARPRPVLRRWRPIASIQSQPSVVKVMQGPRQQKNMYDYDYDYDCDYGY